VRCTALPAHKGLLAGGDIDAIPEDIVSVDDDIANINYREKQEPGSTLDRLDASSLPSRPSMVRGSISSRASSKFARSVLRHIRVTSKHELKERIVAGIDDVNRHPVIHTWSYKLADA
jgi:hypothetical protein